METEETNADCSENYSDKIMVISQWQLALLYLNAGLLGIGLGLFYDVLRMVRMFFGERFSTATNRLCHQKLPLIQMKSQRKHHKRLSAVVIFALDFLFCLVSAIAIILLFYQMNNGKLRFWAFPMAGIGFYLYRMTIGRLVMLCSETVAFFLEAAIRYVFFFALFPWKWAFHRTVLTAKTLINRRMEKVKRRERVRFTVAQETRLERYVKDVMLEQEKGEPRDVGKTKKAVQFESDGQNLSGGHRVGIHCRVRQQRHEVQ